ncbi:MAG TPA: 2-hydroxyacid dehydrogenase [Jiangellaceae bacterium]|nr:2-hydroxyacid dehydrogenase [Jiangellaceae bacterium]
MSIPTVLAPFRAEDGLADIAACVRLHHYDADDALPPAEVLDAVDFYVLPYSLSSDAAALMKQMPRLRAAQLLSAGYEHVVPHVPAGVTLCNGRGIHDASTAELALTLMLASQRNIPGYVRAQDRGEWRQEWRPSLADRRVLILGYGSIGAAIETRLLPFEVEVTRVASRARQGVHSVDELPELLPHAEIVVIVTPATELTRGMVDASFLARLPDDALVVNVARGSIVDTDALVAELECGRLRAALDVTDPEPLPAGHPLWHAPGVLISPHVGGPTSAFWPRAQRLVREQLTRFADGADLANVVIPADASSRT